MFGPDITFLVGLNDYNDDDDDDDLTLLVAVVVVVDDFVVVVVVVTIEPSVMIDGHYFHDRDLDIVHPQYDRHQQQHLALLLLCHLCLHHPVHPWMQQTPPFRRHRRCSASITGSESSLSRQTKNCLMTLILV